LGLFTPATDGWNLFVIWDLEVEISYLNLNDQIAQRFEFWDLELICYLAIVIWSFHLHLCFSVQLVSTG
jgi:hypothetical protein